MNTFRKDRVAIDGSKLRTMRKKKRLSLEDIANSIGAKKHTVSFLEMKRKEVTINMITKIAKAMNLPIEEFYNRKIITPIPLKAPKVREKILPKKIKVLKENIYKYDDILKYMNNWYEKNKKKDFHFSYRFLQKKMNLKSSASPFMIIQKGTLVNDKTIDKFTKILGLDKNEIDYFKVLLLLSGSRIDSRIKKDITRGYRKLKKRK